MNGLVWSQGHAPRINAPSSRAGRIWRGGLSLVVTALTILAVVALLLMVTLLVFIRHGPDGETTIFGRPLLAVATGSMSPTFSPGDLILDSPVSAQAAERLHQGEVITFRSSEYLIQGRPILVTHRIYAVVRNSPAGTVAYRTKGDGNNIPDPGLVAPGAVVGLYEGWRIPYGAYVLDGLHGPLPFVPLVVLLVALLGAGEFRRRWQDLGSAAKLPPPGLGGGGLW